MYTALDFFAGSGLVRVGLEPEFRTLWANDNSPKKRAVYVANNPPEEFHLGPIEDVLGSISTEVSKERSLWLGQRTRNAANDDHRKRGRFSGIREVQP